MLERAEATAERDVVVVPKMLPGKDEHRVSVERLFDLVPRIRVDRRQVNVGDHCAERAALAWLYPRDAERSGRGRQPIARTQYGGAV